MSSPSVEPVHRRHTFRDAAQFLKEYDSNLRHGGLMTAWSGAPRVGAGVFLTLVLPLDLEPIEVEALVVFHSQTHAGLQLRLNAMTRKSLDAAAERCRQAPAEPARPMAHPAAESLRAVSTPAPAPPRPAARPMAPAYNAPAGSVPPRSDGPPSTPPGSVPPGSDAPRTGSSRPYSPFATPSASTSIHTFSSPSRGADAGASWRDPMRYVEEEVISGDLAERPLGEVLLLLGSRRATGRLEVMAPDGHAEIYLRAGSVVRAIEDPLRPNRLGDMLVRAGKIRGSERDSGLKDAARTGSPLGEALQRRGLINSHTLKAALISQLLERCTNQLRRRAGRYTFHAGVTPPPGPSIPAQPPGVVLFRGPYETYFERRPDEMDRIDNEFGGRFLHRAPDAPLDLSPLGVSEAEQGFWAEQVIGAYTLREVYSRTSLSRRTAHALMFALVDRGFLRLEHEMAPEHRIARLRDLLEEKAGQVEAGALFDVLEIHWMATAEDVAAAHTRLHALYDVTKIPVELPAELRAMAARVLMAIDRARDALSPAGERARYRRTVAEQPQIEVCVDLLHTQGEMAIFQGDLRTALHCFAHIVELAPGDRDAASKLSVLRAGRLPAKRPTPRA